MSRFELKIYKKVLERVKPKQWRNSLLYKEKHLWDQPSYFKYFGKTFAVVIITLSFVILLLAGIIEITVWFGIWAGLLLLFVVTCITYTIWVNTTGKRNVQRRERISLEEFIGSSEMLSRWDRIYIKAIRDTLGFLYSVDSNIIYPTDTFKSLRMLGCLPDPYGFELILGVARRLNIYIPDGEVDRIVERLRENSRTVAEMVSVLTEEIELAQDRQKDILKDPDFLALEDEKTSKPKRGTDFLVALCFAIIFALQAYATKFEEGKYLNNPETLYLVLAMALAGFIFGLLFCFVANIITKLSRKFAKRKGRKPKKFNPKALDEILDVNPAKEYVDALILQMQSNGQVEMMFSKSESLPALSEFSRDEIPWFGQFADRLKKLTHIRRIPYIKAVRASAELVVGLGNEQEPKQVRLDVEFCDGPRDGYISLRLGEQA